MVVADHEALQEQADRDGQTVRLVRFVRAGEVLEVRPGEKPRSDDHHPGTAQ
jgi:hypothetical protein